MDLFRPERSSYEKFMQTNDLSYLYQNTTFDWLILGLYFGVLIILALYGLHRYQLVYLYFKYRKNQAQPKARLSPLPVVTVQLPIFNELYVVERLIDSVCRLDYPRDALQIQVLDDSTDETSQLARRKAHHYARAGFDIQYIRRPNREGFKAGALEYGLRQARGEFIAIFDSDFTPQPDTLNRTIHYFSNPSVGMVQVRWGHINRDYSLLTKVQAILLDGHFIMESATRHRAGRFFNFNGTAGMWRKQSIIDAGGWEHDTLTEDLDLSYRAQMKGWEFVFLSDFAVPAELPVEMNSFKAQQYRWAKGSIQTGKKILPKILRSSLPMRIKMEAFFHLSANIAYPLMIVLGLLLFPALIIRFHQGWFELFILDLPLFTLATLSVSSFYLVSQKQVSKNWKSRLKYLPLLMSVGIGLSVSNSKAVLEALFGIDSSFVRTPKFCIQNIRDNWKIKRYRSRVGFLPLMETALGLYFALMIAYSLDIQIYGTIPFLVLFMVGYSYTGLMSLIQPLLRLRLPQYLTSYR